MDRLKDPGQREVILDLLKILCLGLALRTLWLIVYPVPYGEDAFGRIYFKNTLLLSHWLPLTQLIVYLSAHLTDGVFLIRYVFAILGSLAACGFYLFLRLVADRSMSLLGGLLFSVNALYVILSLMPYQDVLFLGLFYASLAFLVADKRHTPRGEDTERTGHSTQLENESEVSEVRRRARSRRFVFGSLLFGLACLTRYEGWFVLPVLVLYKAQSEAQGGGLGRLTRSVGKAALFLGWGPVLWLAFSRLYFGAWYSFLFQTLDGKFYAWNPHFDLLWMTQYAGKMLYWLGLFGSPVILFAAPGLLKLIRSRDRLHPGLKLLFLFVLLVLAFFFLIIGKGHDTVFRFAMIPLSIVLVLTVIGLEATLEWLVRRRAFPRQQSAHGLGRIIVVILVVLLAAYATFPLARLNANPAFRDPYLISNYLDQQLRGGGRALVVADRSKDLADAAPIAYQRIAAQSRLPDGSILSAGLLEMMESEELLEYARRKRVRFLVVFKNFQPWLAADMFYANLTKSRADWIKPVFEVSTAQIYLVSTWPGKGEAVPNWESEVREKQ
ncbi:hypothetical protein MYX78_03555 [Acidobacteria bacterium AH-259-G07]|nr:hypothetical protein [Acidobacteria bacterium AH-259-G07]